MKTVLIIDDNINFLENVSEFLEIEGYKTLIANNGKDGIKITLETNPDLIICDVLMPEMTGHEVLKNLQDQINSDMMPFIFSTSLSEKIDRLETLELGADEYIVKPYDLENLLAIIKTCIKKKNK
jgi:DNA-binding response OmpR family regulator